MPLGAGGLDDAKDLGAVDVLDGYPLRRFVLPASFAVGALQQPSLVLGLRHSARSAAHALVGAAFVGERTDGQTAFDRRSDNFPACTANRVTAGRAARLDLDAVDGNVGGRLEAVGGLGDVTERLVRDVLPFDRAVRPDAEKNHAAGTVQEGAECLHAFFQLAGRALELEGRALFLLEESGKFLGTGRDPRHHASLRLNVSSGLSVWRWRSRPSLRLHLSLILRLRIATVFYRLHVQPLDFLQ